MPFYDRCCPTCERIEIDVLEPVVEPPKLCESCGTPTERAWITKPPNAIGDEMDHLQVNGLKEPRRFRSKLERKRWLKEAGLEEKDCHCPMPDSDKSKHGAAWVSGGTQWLANAEALAKSHHNGEFAGNEPSGENEHFNVKWYDENVDPR
jgi:hypothetical protein